MVAGGLFAVIGAPSPVNASLLDHPFTVPVAVPNIGAAAKLSKLLSVTRAARTAQIELDVFLRQTSLYNGVEDLSWSGSGDAGFTPPRAALEYEGLFYKILASSQAVIVNSDLYVHQVGLSVDYRFGLGGSPVPESSSGAAQWLEGPVPNGPLGVVTDNFVSLLGDLPLMLSHGAKVGLGGQGVGYIVTLPKSALVALYEAHGVPPRRATTEVDSLGHFVCEIDVAPGGGTYRDKVGYLAFYFQSSSYGQHTDLSMFAGYGTYGLSVKVVPPPKSEVRWAPHAADENLTV